MAAKANAFKNMSVPELNEKLKELKTELFNLEEDPWEQHPINDPETEKRLRMAMTRLMIRNHAPIEQYTRMGLEKEYEALR